MSEREINRVLNRGNNPFTRYHGHPSMGYGLIYLLLIDPIKIKPFMRYH